MASSLKCTSRWKVTLTSKYLCRMAVMCFTVLTSVLLLALPFHLKPLDSTQYFSQERGFGLNATLHCREDPVSGKVANGVPSNHQFSHLGLKPSQGRRYLSSRVSYYSNWVACFQLDRFASSGDINPNPGPRNSVNCNGSGRTNGNSTLHASSADPDPSTDESSRSRSSSQLNCILLNSHSICNKKNIIYSLLSPAWKAAQRCICLNLIYHDLCC